MQDKYSLRLYHLPCVLITFLLAMGQKSDRRYLREEGLVLFHGWKVQSITARNGYMAAEVAASCGSRNMGLLTHIWAHQEGMLTCSLYFLSPQECFIASLMSFLLISPVK